MARGPRYDIRFEPVRIGPVTAKNRFHQVPHCNGMGYREPSAVTAMRGAKAEGGWAVVRSEPCEFHPSSEIAPFIELRPWDGRDVPRARAGGGGRARARALAGIERACNGPSGPNLTSREVPMVPAHLPIASFSYDPPQARAQRAGFDIVTVYAAHGFSILDDFLSRRHNTRSDEYGGARAPGTIAMAVYAGRRYAEELDAPAIGDAVPFRRELTELAQEPLAEVQLPG